MELYLMQHGKQKPKEEDPDQPLSAEGRAQIEVSGQALKKMGLSLNAILASSKTRSRQTAEVVAQALGLSQDKIAQTDLVKPTIPPEETLHFLKGLAGAKAVMIAGHLPSLAGIASLLLTGGPKAAIAIENGAVMRIDVGELGPGGGTLRWYLNREQLALIAGQ